MPKSINGPSFSFGNFPLPVRLGAGQTIKLPIIFTPTRPARLRAQSRSPATRRIRNSSSTSPASAFADPDTNLTVTPATLNFGNVTVGSSPPACRLTLSATGGGGNRLIRPVAQFGIHPARHSRLPLTVAVGQNVVVTDRFTPNASGTASGKLTLTSNADEFAHHRSLTGVGVAAGPHSADLTWNAEQGSGDWLQRLSRWTKTGGPYTQINGVLDASTDYTDSTVKSWNNLLLRGHSGQRARTRKAPLRMK